MSEEKMPATEVSSAVDEQEIVNYELAYHVLPTVAEGEVTQVRDEIIAQIENNEGVIGIEESPQRAELAYDIEKYLEGKYRKFNSAYFGWVRFSMNRSQVEALEAAISENRSLLRHLLIRLSKTEEANPFYFHEALAQEKAVETVEEETDIDPNVDAEAVTEVDTEGVSDDTKVTATAPEGEDSETVSEEVTDQESDR